MTEGGEVFSGDLVAAAIRSASEPVELRALIGTSVVAGRDHEVIDAHNETITIRMMGRACPYHFEDAFKLFDLIVPDERRELITILRRYDRFKRPPQSHSLRPNKKAELVVKVVERRVRSLYHFTRASSLASILTFGLRCREGNEQIVAWTDPLRWDCRLDCISLSVSFPNAEMLRAIQLREPHETWCILELGHELLWKKNCLFFARNAAAAGSWLLRTRTLEGADAFEELFNQFGREGDLPPQFPTDVQAEVLVESYIEPGFIKAVHFRSEFQGRSNGGVYANIAVTPELFGNRDTALHGGREEN